ncbi:MAG: hypothetical protein P1U89_19730 [Verrucomicrobiales bacterium]|nr:hypothetical protein [Verrucomicrobiales bacterium]
MSELPEGSFSPASGKLGQMIFENPGGEIKPRLEFFIEIAFRPFELGDETVSPILRINSIQAGVKKWSELAGKTLEFPYHPKPGSVDAGVHLFFVQNPADVTKLTFGEISDGKIPVNFDTEVDFEIEADSELEQVPLTLACDLEIMPLKVATSIEKQCDGDPEVIVKAVNDLVDLDAYGDLEKVPGGFQFPV